MHTMQPMQPMATQLPLGMILLFMVGVVVLAVVGGILWGVVGSGPSGGKRKPNELDQQREHSPVWARLADVAELRLPKGRTVDPRRARLCVLDGVQLYNLPNRSTIVIAPTGSGKTPRVVVPMVNAHIGPCVAATVKGDLLALTHQAREQAGQVWVFDPSNASGTPTVRWSPLATIDTWADALDAARWIQESSKVEGSTGGVQDREFWDAQARFLLAPLLFMCARTPGQTVATLTTWLSADRHVQAEVTNQLQTLGDRDALREWEQFCTVEPKMMSSVITTAKTVLEAWTHPRVRAAVSVRAGEEALDIDTLLSGRNTLYLVAPAGEQTMFTSIYETLVNAILMKMERAAQARGGLPPAEPLLLMLDEAANIAPLRRLGSIASKGASEGVLLVSVWQDEGQITAQYGPARARTIVANHTAKIFMPGISDPDTLRTLSDLIGQDTFEVTSTTYGEKITKTRSTTIADIAPKRWLRQMAADQVIVIVGRFPPIKASLPAWFEQKQLRAQVDPKVAEQFDSYYGEQDTPGKRNRIRGRRRQGTDQLDSAHDDARREIVA